MLTSSVSSCTVPFGQEGSVLEGEPESAWRRDRKPYVKPIVVATYQL